jgi:two-component system, NarL family, sensor histidine kinase DevS
MLTALLRRPATVFSMLAIAVLLAHGLAVLLIAHMPGSSIETVTFLDGTTGLRDGTRRYDSYDRAAFVDRSGRLRLDLAVAELTPTLEPRGTKQEIAAAYARRDAIARLLREPGMRLRLPDGRMPPAMVRPGRVAHLGPGAWLSIAVALGSTLAGLWALVLRPREWAARMCLLSGLGLAVGTITIGASTQISLAASARTLFWLAHVNYLSASVFGTALVALFARYPRMLVSKAWLVALSIAQGIVWVLGLIELDVDMRGIHLLIVILLGLAILVLAGVQGWLSRRDPALRASFILIWSSLLLCIGLFSALNMVPQLLGVPDLVPEWVSAPGFLLFYLALAVAIVRYRLFDLGGWAVNVALSALLLIAVLAVDFALVLVTGGTWTVSLAFLSAAILWLPLRELLLRRMDRRRDRRDMLLLRGASEVAFAPRPEQQPDLWMRLLDRQFSPLTIAPAACDAVAIRADGRELAIPSPLGGAGTGLALRFASQGKRLFNSGDKAVAAALVTLVEEMVDARAAYDRGVRAERQRIARDLHDDVGARLMTTLHRGDLATVHADVREAMADMRLIIDGMSDQDRHLSALVADLRHETVNRLVLANIHVEWPISPVFDDERPVDALNARVLFSVVRELMSNVIRHAGATTASVGCDLAGDMLAFSVRDDGCGFDLGSEATLGNGTLGNGLRNIRKRLEELGGSIQAHSGKQGTTIAIRLPIASRERGMAAGPRSD